ncbi:MAG: metallophosphatase family protein [Bacteroidales bacterium]|nr:metallophosphatase family protein [Bacteroidales bacterium]
MKKIGVISDTHTFLHPKLFDFFKDVDEIWHAGDFGNIETADRLQAFKPLRGVYGNIDDTLVRRSFPQFNVFRAEEAKVVITHIGGYPEHYYDNALEIIRKEKPDIFIAGHSHILKIIYDKPNQLLFINPGAAGLHGIHHVITFVRFTLDKTDIRDVEIFETKKNPTNERF